VYHAQSGGRFLTPEQASRVYDWIGRLQDWQAVYEGRAIREVIRLASFDSAKSVFEFGCGTGAFAAKVLRTCLPPTCRYVGIDVSPRMVRLATSRLKKWAERIDIKLSDGSAWLHEPDCTFDRFVSNYVFDLLAPEYAAGIISEAHRVLNSSGKLCLVSLGCGTSGLSRIATVLWERVWRLKPELVGGCRPVDLRSLLIPGQWLIDHHAKLVSFGFVSEVIVASRRSE
jgi:ubiquinone/menaquinone biosynthesis C-methylase UbiE